MGLGFRIGIELVVGVAIGTGGGWALDRWLGTAPWLMIVGLIVGFAAGLRNVFRSADTMGKKWDAAEQADAARNVAAGRESTNVAADREKGK
ncbi:MAG: AtpZ/AtpI family protein [Sphingomonadaceae bacterium]|nr:AtpZ/AtpI family protein [Sphingomonadaceae bacterium]